MTFNLISVGSAIASLPVDSGPFLVIGHFGTVCGLQRAADLTALYLERHHAKVVRVDLTPALGWPNNFSRGDTVQLHEIPDNSWSRIIAPLIVAPYTIEVINYVRSRVSEPTPVIPYCYWEMTRFPSFFRSVGEIADEIWFPTTFVKSAFERTFPDLSPKTRIFRTPVDEDSFRRKTLEARNLARDLFDIPRDAFVGGYTFASNSCFDRKNPLAAIRAFNLAFGCEKDTYLLVRDTTPEFYPPGATALVEAARQINGVRLIRNNDPSHRLLDFYDAIDVLISLHRSEGYGLTIAEALQTGAEVITTGWGLAPELAESSNVHIVSETLVSVDDSQGFYKDYKNLFWADPNEEEAALFLRAIRKRLSG